MRFKIMALSSVLLCLAFILSIRYSPSHGATAAPARSDSIPTPALQSPDPVLVLTRQWLPGDIFRLLLPINLAIPRPQASPPESTQLTIADMQFVGVDGDWKRAKAFAIAVPGATPHPAIGSFLSGVEPNADLKSVRDRALRIPNGPDWLVVMSINAVWSPWKLTLSVRGAEIGRRAGAPTTPPSHVEEAFRNPATLPQLLDLSLTQINAPIDASTTMQLNVAMSFGPDTITFGFVPTASAAAWQPPPPGLQGLRVETAAASPDTSVIFSIPHSFSNTILDLVYGKRPLPLGVSIGGGELKASSLRVSTTTNVEVCPDPCLTLSGVINTPGGTPAVPILVDWAGSDLFFSNFRVSQNLCQAQPECGQLEFFARAGALLLVPQHRGRLLRPQNVREVGKFNLAGKTLGVDLLLQNTKVGPTGVSASGYATLQPR